MPHGWKKKPLTPLQRLKPRSGRDVLRQHALRQHLAKLKQMDRNSRIALAQKSKLNWQIRQNLLRRMQIPKTQRLEMARKQQFINRRNAFQKLPKLNRQVIALRQRYNLPGLSNRQKRYLEQEINWRWNKIKYS